MRFRVSYEVSRGNSLENEDHVADEVLFLRHQSIDVGDRDHNRDGNCGWLIVPVLEQVVWLQRHYAKTARYVHIGAVAAVVEPEDLEEDILGVGALLRRIKFVYETLDQNHGCIFLRHADDDAQLASDTAALLSYTTHIEAVLLPASRGNDWEAARAPDSSTLVSRRHARENGVLVVPPSELPLDVAGLRRLIESLRFEPRRRVALRYDDGDYDIVHTVATWLAEATDSTVSPEQV